MKDKHIQMYMRIAEAAAKTSSALRLQVGACVVKNNAVIAVSYNGLPSFIDGPVENKVYVTGVEWLSYEDVVEQYPFEDEVGRYKLVTKKECRHAEKNALLALAKSNESSIDATMFLTHSCCDLCAVDIVDAGISCVYYRNEYRNTEGLEYLRSNNVEVIKI